MRNRQQGIALFQVLLLVALLGLMAVHFSYQAKVKVAQASAVKDQLSAELKATSAEAKLMFSLLTQPLLQGPGDNQTASQVVPYWRFDNQGFQIASGQQIKLQDINGLYGFFGTNSTRQLQRLLIFLGKPEDEASLIANRLLHWQGRNGIYGTAQQHQRQDTFASLGELKFIEGIDPLLFEQLKQVVYPWPNANFNPLNAPEAVLTAIYGEEQANLMQALRTENRLDRQTFVDIARPGSGESDYLTYLPGNRFSIQVQALEGDAVVTKTGFWYIQPYSKHPVIWLQ